LRRFDLKCETPAAADRVLERALLQELPVLADIDHRFDRRSGRQAVELGALEVDHDALGAFGISVADACRDRTAAKSPNRVVALKADLVGQLDRGAGWGPGPGDPVCDDVVVRLLLAGNLDQLHLSLAPGADRSDPSARAQVVARLEVFVALKGAV